MDFRPATADDAPAIGTLAWFLLVFFVFQMLTSATEEIGWRGYLLEKLLPGRNFWDAGWMLGWVWAGWHLPVVIFIFMQQGMTLAPIIGHLAAMEILDNARVDLLSDFRVERFLK